MESKLVQVIGKNFCAGIVIKNKKVVEAAPILCKKLCGLTEKQVKEVVEKNRWKWEEVDCEKKDLLSEL